MTSRWRTLARAMVVPGRLGVSRLDWTSWARKFRLQHQILHIDPRQVSGYLHVALAKQLRARAVRRKVLLVDGEWDREVAATDFTSTSVYASCRLHWLEDVAWEETPVFREYVDRIDRGAMKRFATRQDLLERYRALDVIYEQVREQRVLSPSPENLIRANLDRHGRLIVGPDGRHRHTIALILGLEQVPARVGYVHPAALERLRALRGTAPLMLPRGVGGT